jgi:hypothetical protein
MKAPLVSTLFVVLAGMALAESAQAQVLEKFVNSCARDCKRNNCWPEPFVRTDRAAVRLPFDMMVQRGWQQQNLLSGLHFKDKGAELNEAGQAKIHWILTDAPRQHRTIFVQMADSPDQTAARVAAVQEVAGRVAINTDQMPMVVAVAGSAPGWSAERADAVGRKFQTSMPAPVLPAKQDEQQ